MAEINQILYLLNLKDEAFRIKDMQNTRSKLSIPVSPLLTLLFV